MDFLRCGMTLPDHLFNCRHCQKCTNDAKLLGVSFEDCSKFNSLSYASVEKNVDIAFGCVFLDGVCRDPDRNYHLRRLSCSELYLGVQRLVAEVLGAQLGQERGKEREVGLHFQGHPTRVYQSPT